MQWKNYWEICLSYIWAQICQRVPSNCYVTITNGKFKDIVLGCISIIHSKKNNKSLEFILLSYPSFSEGEYQIVIAPTRYIFIVIIIERR